MFLHKCCRELTHACTLLPNFSFHLQVGMSTHSEMVFLRDRVKELEDELASPENGAHAPAPSMTLGEASPRNVCDGFIAVCAIGFDIGNLV